MRTECLPLPYLRFLQHVKDFEKTINQTNSKTILGTLSRQPIVSTVASVDEPEVGLSDPSTHLADKGNGAGNGL